MTYSTTAMFGKRAMSQLSAEDYIDWAVQMLMQDCDSRHLRILAGLGRKTTSAFEAEDYFLRCMKELNLSVPDSEKAIWAYAREAAQEIVDGRISGKQGVRNMFQFCLATDYDHDFVIWLELDDALDNLLQDEHPYSYKSATLENFEIIAKHEAEKFIDLMNRKIAF